MQINSFNIIYIIFFVTLFLLKYSKVEAQTDSGNVIKAISPVFGFSQWNVSTVEIGISRNTLRGNYPDRDNKGISSLTQSISAETYFTRHIVVAPKYSIWHRKFLNSDRPKGKAFLFNFSYGLSLVYFTDFKINWATLRPEISFCRSFTNGNFFYYDRKDTKKYKLKQWFYIRRWTFKIGYAYDIAVLNAQNSMFSPHRIFLTIFQEGNKDRTTHTKPSSHF